MKNFNLKKKIKENFLMLKMKEKVKKIRYMTQKEIPRSMMTSKNMKRNEE